MDHQPVGVLQPIKADLNETRAHQVTVADWPRRGVDDDELADVAAGRGGKAEGRAQIVPAEGVVLVGAILSLDSPITTIATAGDQVDALVIARQADLGAGSRVHLA